MKKKLSIFLSLLIFCSIFILPASSANQKELTVVFSHDLHSYIDTREYKSDGKTVEVGGFAKIKTIIDDVKSKSKNTLVVDGGDFSMGTLFQTVFSEAAIELRMLGQLGFDATTFGNHEFDYSSQGLAKMLTVAKESNDPLPAIVSTNIDWNNSSDEHAIDLKKAMDNYGVNDYTIVTKGNVKIAIFGGMGIDSIACAPNSGVSFNDFVETAKETVSKIEKEENPDIIVCLSHSGISDDSKKSEDELLAKAVPQIDVIVSGHTHSKLEKPIVVGKTIIGCCGEYGQNMGKIDLKQNGDGTWDLKDYKLIPVDNKIKADEEFLGKVEEYRTLVDEFLKGYGFENYSQVIANSPYDYPDIRVMNENHVDQALGNLISDSFIYSVKQAEGENYVPVDVALVPVGVVRSNIAKGPITISNAYEVLSLGIGPDGVPGYPLASIYLTGKELKTTAEVDASITPLMSAAQLYCSGLQYTFNPNRIILNRVTDVKLKTEKGELKQLEDDKLYRVVGDLYSAQMLGAVMDQSKGILSIIPKDAKGNPIKDFNKIVIYDQKGSEVKAWYAFASYLQSFDEVDGVPTIPAKYSKAENRKVVDDSKNIIKLVKNPNKIFFAVLAIIILFIAIVTVVVVFIVKKVRTKKKKND